ncbi:S1C family serine protease [Crateriforma conspicua]|uniref:Putative periplasmic serine endoprotease DegP-like n=1 Tax=Crateriforma conspicua TaxID=2527996 RepID=A0A5C5YA70_9PLAN|nr:S1C family serine protease [Crateriforma conspicua]TWT71828.1 putative periplasmic serine endoprotease DegP-like precursor [Crateriforma conspicua]
MNWTSRSVGNPSGQRTAGLALLLTLGIAWLSSSSATGQTIVANPLATSTTAVSARIENDYDGDTKVTIPDPLRDELRYGGVPDSIDEFRQLEDQVQQVARRGARCTVGVKIGPAQGCGVIITQSGLVLTAAHVAMRPGKTAEIMLDDGRTVLATTLGMNRHVDAGLLRIHSGQNNGRPWPCASPGTSDRLRPGMWCVATGHPGGYDTSRGTVTRVGRILAIQSGSLLTDCALIGGDSGGPLFDIEGRLIAIHSRIGNDVADNLHVPVDYYKESWDRLMAGEAWGSLPGFRPVIGVTGNNSYSDARILDVHDGSPAQDAGIEPGDVITQFGEVSVSNFESLTRAVSNTMPGERVVVWLTRGGTQFKVLLEIGRGEDDD